MGVLIAAVIALVLMAGPASADVFLRVLAPGVTSIGSNQQALKLSVTTAPVVLRVEGKNEGMTAADFTGATVQYFLDEQPLSPVITGPTTGTGLFAWTWTPPAGFKGVHILQARVTGGPVGAVYKNFSTMVFGAVDTGPQRLPALPPVALAGTSLSSTAESPAVGWYQYTGQPPVLPSLPLRGIQAPYPPVNPQSLLTSSGWIIEPLTNAGHPYSSAVPSICYANGQPWVCKHYQQAGNLSFQAALDVAKDLHTDGPRGKNVVSPYNTCVPTPDRPGYGTCVDLSGRVATISPTGYAHTLVGPWQACDTCPVEWRGDFEGGVRFNVPNDLNYDFVDSSILYVADTGNHRIARIDLRVTPPKITTLAGGPRAPPDTARGYVDGPGLTAKFNEPYSVISHGPHSCPGRPEFTDCVHLYVGDMRNGAIRVLELHRQGEIPPVTTLLGGPTKLPDVDAAYAAPANFVQTCDQLACSVNWPMVLRWDSNFNLIWGETNTGAIRRYNWATKKAELITTRPGGKRTAFPGWLWLDVDRRGEVGPKDDILWTTSVTSSGDLYRISADGTRIGLMDGSGNLQQGPARYVTDAMGHYGWMSSIVWGTIWSSGYGSVGIRAWRPYTTEDHQTALNITYYNTGRTIWGNNPAVSVLYGSKGWNRLGLPTWDTQANLSDVDLKAWLRTLVPTLTAAQEPQLMYFVRWNSPRAVAEPILVPGSPGWVPLGAAGPTPPPQPVQYTVTITKAGTGQGTVSGAGTFPAASTPTLGATPVTGSQFTAWSGCSAATTPSITLPALTANVSCVATFTLLPPPGPGFVIGARVKVVNSNALNVRSGPGTSFPTVGPPQGLGKQGIIVEGPKPGVPGGDPWVKINYDTGTDGWSSTLYLQVVTAPPVPVVSIDGFTAVPGSIAVGQSAVLTWATTNATAVTLNGLTVGVDGSQTVSPSTTTNYDLLAHGVSRRVTVTVTPPPSGHLPGTWKKVVFPVGTVYQPGIGGNYSLPPDEPGAAYSNCPRPIQTDGPDTFRSYSGAVEHDDQVVVFGGGHAGHPGNNISILNVQGTRTTPYPAECPAPYIITTLTAPYAVGGTSIQVASTDGFQKALPYRVFLGNANKTRFRVTAVAGTKLTGLAEPTAAGAPPNDGPAAAGSSASVVNFVHRGINGGAALVSGRSPTGNPWVQHMYANHCVDKRRNRYVMVNGNGLQAYDLLTARWLTRPVPPGDPPALSLSADGPTWGSNGGMLCDDERDSVWMFATDTSNGKARGIYEQRFHEVTGQVIETRYVRAWPTISGWNWANNGITALYNKAGREAILVVTPNTDTANNPRNRIFRFPLGTVDAPSGSTTPVTWDQSWKPGTPQYDQVFAVDSTRARLVARVPGETWMKITGGAWIQNDVTKAWRWLPMAGSPGLTWWSFWCSQTSDLCGGISARSTYGPVGSSGGISDLWLYRRP
jgi:hypothetical protein